MIEFIFTIDYEIYGNGQGTLKELVIEPTRKLISLFKKADARFVSFTEAVEFQKIEEYRADDDAGGVREQIAQLADEGFEVGLHLHPWWANARREQDSWQLDWTQRNICAMPENRIDEIVSGAIDYLKSAIGNSQFEPVSFRGGLWLMQPTKAMATVLARHGVKIDSSVFKGGRIQDVGLDYRPSSNNAGYWRFENEVNEPDGRGILLEVPIHTEMVPFWKMLGGKRVALQRKVPVATNGGPLPRRWADFARLRYPRKLDFCRMDLEEMCAVMDRVIDADKKTPKTYKPIVSIGHTKDLVDFEAVNGFLKYLAKNKIQVIGFEQVLERLESEAIVKHG